MNDIHSLAEAGNAIGLREAILSGADVNEKDEFGSTALQAAIAERQIEIVGALLELGADVRIQDADGLTALHYAIEFKLPDVLESLVKHCPEAVAISNKHGNQPLWTAVFNARGNYGMVSTLLRYGADPNHLNNVNLCPLDIPKRKREPALLQLLEAAPDAQA